MRDVVAVNLTTHKVRLMAKRLGAADAEAVIKMAVMRRGMEEEFFVDAPAGQYADGDMFWNSDV
jgi:hypothetical protein